MRSSRWIALALVGALWLAPASAHVDGVKHTWKKHFRKLAKTLFYTKEQSRLLFLDAAEGDARYQRSGQTVARVLSLPADRLDVDFANPNAADPTRVTIAPAVAFSPSADETVYFSFEVPVDWDGASPLTLSIRWSGEAVMGLVHWTTFARAYRVGTDLDGLSVGTGVTVAPDTATPGAIIETQLTTIQPTVLRRDHVVAVGIRREATAFDDTMATDAHLMEVRIGYTGLA